VIVSGAAIRVVHGRLGRHGSRTVPILDDEINGHLAFETADVSVTEVVAQLMHLPTNTHSTLQ